MINQKQVLNLIEDVSYISFEIEALSKVINSVPYDRKPAPDELSIIDNLISFNSKQKGYYWKVIKDVFHSNKPLDLNDYDYISNIEKDEIDEVFEKDVKLVLSEIAKHRDDITRLIEVQAVKDWKKTITKNKAETTIFNFVREMVQKERVVLKQIAELIAAFQNDRQFRRIIETRANNS